MSSLEAVVASPSTKLSVPLFEVIPAVILLLMVEFPKGASEGFPVQVILNDLNSFLIYTLKKIKNMSYRKSTRRKS